MNPLKPCDKNRTPGGFLTVQFWKLKLQVQRGVIPEHCGSLICPKGEDVLNCAVNFFHATVERCASNKPVTLLDGYTESHTHFFRFCEKKNINTRCVCVMAKESSAASEGLCQEVCFFDKNPPGCNPKFWS